MRELSIATGATFFDFAAEFPRDQSYFTDGIHVNEEGARLKSELFAQFLIDKYLLPPKR